MPNATILRTAVTPDGGITTLFNLKSPMDGCLAEPQSIKEGTVIRLTVEATTRAYKSPPLPCVQLAAIDVALEALRNLSTQLRREIHDGGYGTPPYKNQI